VHQVGNQYIVIHLCIGSPNIAIRAQASATDVLCYSIHPQSEILQFLVKKNKNARWNLIASIPSR